MNTLVIDKVNHVLHYVKSRFVGKDEIIDLMGIALVSRENLFLHGPPGTAKSAMVRELASHIEGKTFEYLLTRFTEPNELFGPFDIRKLREGDLTTNTEGMLPEANFVFLDELLNANSAILNSLLMVLNERVFRRGREKKDLPLLLIVGASNNLPEDEVLQALFDRFLLRAHCGNTPVEMLHQVMEAGWNLEKKEARSSLPKLQTEELFALQKLITKVDLSDVRPKYIELVQALRNAGIVLSDRRSVKLQRVIAASALLCKRDKAILSDLWVLRYIWDNLEQQELLNQLVAAVVDADTSENMHPRAKINALPDAEQLFEQVELLSVKWLNDGLTTSEKVLVKDQLRSLQGRSEWLSNDVQREAVQKPINELWQKILESE